MTGRPRCRGIPIVLIVGAVLCAPADARAVPHVVITVDVESQALSLPAQVDAVCSDGSACGLMAIVEILRERELAGTFFMNVYEYKTWGEAAMADLATRLQNAGQDVALHTHPQWAFDPLRNGMHQYTLDEQTAIVRDGVRHLAAWTGRPVVAHRAGDYSADERTIDALNRNGIRVDSSLFSGNSRSHLSGLGLAANVPSSFGPLVEIPITTYQREERPRYFGELFAPVTSIRKIDPDWFLDGTEARSALDSLIDADAPFIIVFLHSFSLLDASSDKPPTANRHSRDIFLAILDHVREKGLPVVTMRQLAESPAAATAGKRDFPARVAVAVDLHRYVWHRLRSVGAPKLGITIVALALAVGCAGLIAVEARRRRNRNVCAETSGVSSHHV